MNFSSQPNIRRIITQIALVLLGLYFQACAAPKPFFRAIFLELWSPSGNPYIISDTATVPSGQTLTIQPGVIVWMGQGRSIIGNGVIQALGTSTQRIRFQSPVDSRAIGITFPSITAAQTSSVIAIL